MLKLNLNHIVWELEAAKEKNGGKSPCGAITLMVCKMTHLLPWLTKDMIQHQLKSKGMMMGLVDGDNDYPNCSSGKHDTSLPGGTLSTLTRDSAADNTKDDIAAPPHAQNNKPPDHITTMVPQQHRHHTNHNEEQEEGNTELMVEEGNTTAAIQLQHPPVEIW